MNNNIISVKIASTIVSCYYKRLMNLAANDMENTEEYNDTLYKLKKAIKGEKNIYEGLTKEDYDELINYYQDHELENSMDARIYTKIRNYQRLNMPNAVVFDGDILLSSAITTKVLIDVLKLTNKRIDNLDDYDKDIIKIYYKIMKYTYLSSNNYIERLALENNFSIEKIPVINFYMIEKVSKVKFMDYAQDLFMQYIKDSIEELNNINEDDEYLNKYTEIFETSRIEVMLPYLNKDSLVKMALYLNDLKINNNTITKVKKLLIKRKEEFE